MKPIIGINCDFEDCNKQPYSFLYENYSEAVIKAGGIPLLLPIINEKKSLEIILDKVNGLLLTGGDDVPPQQYKEKRHEKTVCVHPDKYTSDFILVTLALRLKKPILAICYGAQLVNVALGGSLIQDIPAEIKTNLIHKTLENDKYTHPVIIKKGTLLHKIIGTDCIEVNSTHHQATKKLGKGLIDTACTDDGIIEAIEGEDYPFLVGVQWHPERMINNTQHLKLFKALINTSK